MPAIIDEQVCIKLLDAAREASAHAYCPYSNFAVGAAVLAVDGNIFTGVNVENASYGLTICAERAAVALLIANGCAHHARVAAIKAIAVVSAKTNPCYPCGACLQVIAEFATSDCMVILADENGNPVRIPLMELLPMAFKMK